MSVDKSYNLASCSIATWLLTGSFGQDYLEGVKCSASFWVAQKISCLSAAVRLNSPVQADEEKRRLPADLTIESWLRRY